MNRPIIAITMGDPAGNGSELCVKILSKKNIYERIKPVIIGDAKCIEDAIRFLNLNNFLDVNIIKTVNEGKYEFGNIDVLDLDLVDIERMEYGKISQMCGNAAFYYVKKAIELAKNNKVNATVTNAISKEAINLAGHNFSGHTEIYAYFTDSKEYTMMLAHENLRVVHVSTHVSLRKACDLVKKERVYEVIKLAYTAMKDIGIDNPKIGVSGLNPHSGENGMFGKEEIEEIQPAIDKALRDGINIVEKKPISPDTIFSKAIGGWYDIVVCMYHDQGHIPLKVVGFVYNRNEKKWDAVSGINVTLGIPIIRVSVDHGTGFDLAGKGVSSEMSLENAVNYATLLCKNRENGRNYDKTISDS